MNLSLRLERWPTARPYRFGKYSWTEVEQCVVTLRDQQLVAHGEAAGVYYKNDVPAIMLAQIEAIRGRVEAGINRDELSRLLPAGGARNALDCALWDLESQRSGQPVWQHAGVPAPRPLLCSFTIGADTPDAMAEEARAFPAVRAIKLKLIGKSIDAERVRAVRSVCPQVWLGVDFNQTLNRPALERLLPVLIGCGVALIEQPLPAGREAELDGLNSPIPLAADESVSVAADLPALSGRFDVINIKLDKCGGLTEALRMADEARRLGLKIMVGNMLGTSRAMAPAFVLGQLCDVVDLDGPLLLARDVTPGVSYENGQVWCPGAVWGGGA